MIQNKKVQIITVDSGIVEDWREFCEQLFSVTHGANSDWNTARNNKEPDMITQVGKARECNTGIAN